MTQISKRIAVVMLGGALLAAGATWAVTTGQTNNESKEQKAPKPKANLTFDDRPVARDLKMSSSFAPVVKKVAPSVVKVSTTTKMKQMQGNPFDDPFRYFFGAPRNPRVPGNPQNRRGGRGFNGPIQHGIGSGVIVTKDGYILTNNHVVDDADELKVALQDGREFTAKVVGKDPKSDVAVIKIDATDLPGIEIADSDKIEVGDVVLAIGNPFGIGQTVTMGIVSAVGRAASLGLDYEDFIQTDAAVNPGNSGGALVDAEGRLIGINTAIYSESGGNQGIGFAIPTALARTVMESLIQNGKVIRGYMGIGPQEITPTLAKAFKLEGVKGALVGEVVPKGPADKAGLKNGDIITEVSGKPVQDSRHLRLEVARSKPGETLAIKLLREGKPMTVNVTVKELPGSEKQVPNEPEESEQDSTLNGVGVADIDAQARQQLNIPDEIKGAIVTEVEPESGAANAGLRPGDVITEINHHAVKSADDAVKLTQNTKSKTTLLRVWSNGATRYMGVEESK